MKIPEIAHILAHAMEIARSAGKVHLKYFRTQEFRIDNKLTESDVVTTADKEAEKLIIDSITKSFPSHSILAEESGEKRGTESEVEWVIDPLDGTTNFSQGLPLFCVSIGVKIKGKDAIGVVFNPYLNEMFHAVDQEGAFLNGKPLHCGNKKKMSESVVSTGFPIDKAFNRDNNLENVSRVMPVVRGLRRLGSAALDLSYVAAGYLDGYWEMNLHEWDVVAGRLIVREAGAIYDIWRPEGTRGICALAASPEIFPQLRQLIQ